MIIGISNTEAIESLARTVLMDLGGGRGKSSIGVSTRENRRIIVLLFVEYRNGLVVIR